MYKVINTINSINIIDTNNIKNLYKPIYRITHLPNGLDADIADTLVKLLNGGVLIAGKTFSVKPYKKVKHEKESNKGKRIAKGRNN